MPDPIYWMLLDSHQSAPEALGVLSPSELRKYSAFRFPKRRDEWLLGRRVAKALVHSIPAYRHYPMDQIEIRNNAEGAPYLQLPGRAAPAERLTISHSENFALCALSAGLDLKVGTDLEKIEARTETFILDYFTPVERQLVEKYPAETRPIVVTLIWSVKESMLKALGIGLRRDTRSVEVLSLGGGLSADNDHGEWQRIQVGEQPTNLSAWSACWQRRDPFILTLAVCAATQAEIQTVQLMEKRGG